MKIFPLPPQDSVVQERLIDKYMSLPNEIWDSVIQRATAVSEPVHKEGHPS